MRAMHRRIAMFGIALATLGVAAPALAISNPLVAEITPAGGGNVHGNVTFFQLGSNVQVGLNLSGGNANAEAVDIRKGTCKSYSDTARWPLGASQDTRLPNTKLQDLVGSVLLIHKTQDESSPVAGCAQIKG